MSKGDFERIVAMRRHLAECGVPDSTAAPPLWKLFWRMGFAVPPPPFMGAGRITLVMGGFFGVFWGLVMWLIMWSRQGMTVWIAVAAAAVAGAAFGLSMAFYFRRLARKHGLAAWHGLSRTAGSGVEAP